MVGKGRGATCWVDTASKLGFLEHGVVALPLAPPISYDGVQGRDGVVSAVRGHGGDVTWRGCELEAGAGIANHRRGAHPRVRGQWPEGERLRVAGDRARCSGTGALLCSQSRRGCWGKGMIGGAHLAAAAEEGDGGTLQRGRRRGAGPRRLAGLRGRSMPTGAGVGVRARGELGCCWAGLDREINVLIFQSVFTVSC